MKHILAFSKLVGSVFFIMNFLFSCSDPTLVGADLLDDFKANIETIDTLSITSSTVVVDSILTFNPYNFFSSTPYAGQLDRFLFGDFDDPIFGSYKAEIFIQPQLNVINSNFAGATLDSVVLLLPYDSVGFEAYPDFLVDEDFGIEVYRVTEDMPSEPLYSFNRFAYDPNPIGSAVFRPSLDTLAFASDTIGFPFLAVKLDTAFGNEILSKDSTVFASDDALNEFLKGFYLRPTLKTKRAIGFNLRIDLSNKGLLYLFYHQGGEAKVSVLISSNFSVRTISVNQDLTGSLVSQFTDRPKADTVFVHGLGGIRTKITFPYIDNLKDLLINKAELELQAFDKGAANFDLYSPVNQLVGFQSSNDGTVGFIEDILISLARGRDLEESFGGNLTNDNTYRINITAAVQKMLEGEIPKEIFLGSFNTANDIRGSIMYGANHPQFPMKLRITATRK